ncbi:MAG TPA: hypothetical protein VFT37_11695 [Telluria sp.]|nr:hypothetical protein [Telluria sp.]
MKRVAVLLAGALALSACSYIPAYIADQPAAPAPVKRVAPAVGADGQPLVMVDGVAIERVAFRSGVSSATVEKMAAARQCKGGLGAGLVSDKGPVEVYRMACDNGQVFMARCEMRQCTPLK